MASILAPGKVRHYPRQAPPRPGHAVPPPPGADAGKGLSFLPMGARAPRPRHPTVRQQWPCRTCATTALAGEAPGLGVAGPTKTAGGGGVEADACVRAPAAPDTIAAALRRPDPLPSPQHPSSAAPQGAMFGGCSSLSSSGKEEPRPATTRGTNGGAAVASTQLPPQHRARVDEERASGQGPASAAPRGIIPEPRGPVAAHLGFVAAVGAGAGHRRLNQRKKGDQERPEGRVRAPAKTAAELPRPPTRRREGEGATGPLAPAEGRPRPRSGGGDNAGASSGGGGGGADAGVDGGGAAAAGFVPLVRSWSEAVEVLELMARVGGPPPPRVQLKLLQQSRSFGSGSGDGGGGGAARAGVGPGLGGGFGAAAAAAGGWVTRGGTFAGPCVREGGLLPRGGGQGVGVEDAGGLDGARDEWAWLEALAGEMSDDGLNVPADTTAVEVSAGLCNSAGLPTSNTITSSPTTTTTRSVPGGTEGAGRLQGLEQGQPREMPQGEGIHPPRPEQRPLPRTTLSADRRAGAPEGLADTLAEAAAAATATAAMMEAAEDAGWRADWDLEWDAQIQLHAHWLLRDPGPDGAAGLGSPPAAASAAEVLLPGHVAAAAAARAGPQYDPIPPLRPRARSPDVPYLSPQHQQQPVTQGQLQWQLQKQGVQLDVQRDGDPHHVAARRRPIASPQPLRPPSPARLPAPAVGPAWGVAAAGSGSAAIFGRPGETAAASDAAAAKLAAVVLAKIVNDATVVQPENWTDAQVGALLQSAAKLAHRYPGILGPPPPRRPPSSPPLPAVGAPGAAAVAARVAAGVAAAGTAASGHGGGSAAAATAAAAVQLRVQLQQLLLRLDGLLETPSRRDGDAAKTSAKAARTRTAAPSAVTTATSNASDEAVRWVDDDAGAAAAPGALPVAAAASAVWAAATLQLRLSPDGLVRRCLLSTFLRSWRRLRAPRRGQQQHQEQQHQEQQQQRSRWQSQQRRRWRFGWWPQRLRLRSLGAPARGTAAAVAAVAAAALRPGQLAEMLWALAMLGIQMPSLWIDSVLRALAAAGPQYARTAACHRLSRAREPTPGGQAAALTRTKSLSSSSSSATAAAAARTATIAGGGGADAGDGGGDDGGGGGDGAVTSASGRRGVALLTAVQLTRVAWAVVELRAAAGREDVTRPWAGHLFSGTQDRLRRLSASQLVDLVWNIARGRRHPTGPWRRALAAALAAATPRLLPWQVARAMAGLAKLRLCMPYQVVAGLLRALLLQLDAAQPSDVAAVVWALRFVSWPYTEAFVRTHRRDLLDLAAATRPRLGSLEPPQLVQLADGFAHLRLLPGSEWMRLHRDACIRLKPRFSEANRRKLRHAYAIIYTL